MKSIIYIRTSTEDQNPENQLKECLTIYKKEYGDYEIIQDQESAWNDLKERKGFEKLKGLIKSKSINHLIVWDFDRVYRNRKRFVEFLSLLKAYQISLHSYRQEWIEELYKVPAPWNEIIYDMVIQILGWLAEEESNKKSQRVRAAIRIKEDGAYSYKGNKWGRKQYSAQIIKKVQALHSEGKSMRQITSLVKVWDNKGNEKSISIGGVHKILSGNHPKSSVISDRSQETSL